LGRGVSLTKQESQTRVPSFRVKSTLRLESIAAPHFPQTSPGVSLIGFHLFYRTTASVCLVLPSRRCLLRRSCCIYLGDGVETGIAIVAAVHADVKGAEKIFLDETATMRTSGLPTSAIRAQPFASDGKRPGGRAALLTGGKLNFGHSGHSIAEIVHPKCRKVRLPVFQKSKESQRPGKQMRRKREIS